MCMAVVGTPGHENIMVPLPRINKVLPEQQTYFVFQRGNILPEIRGFIVFPDFYEFFKMLKWGVFVSCDTRIISFQF